MPALPINQAAQRSPTLAGAPGNSFLLAQPKVEKDGHSGRDGQTNEYGSLFAYRQGILPPRTPQALL